MRFYEFGLTEEKVFPIASLMPTDTKRGRLRRELSRSIAQKNTSLEPTDDDLAIAFMRYCQAQNAIDDEAESTGDYQSTQFAG